MHDLTEYRARVARATRLLVGRNRGILLAMPEEQAPRRRQRLGEPPSEVELTLLYRERGLLEEWLARSATFRAFTRTRVLLALVLALALGAIAALVAGLSLGGGGRGQHAASALFGPSGGIGEGDLRLRRYGGLNAANASLRQLGAQTAGADRPGPAGVAAAYGYPLRCLSITISTIDPAFARADYNHASPCGRYDGYVTAIFQRVDGAWRPVLHTLDYTCPVSSVPATVQRQLAICPSPVVSAH